MKKILIIFALLMASNVQGKVLMPKIFSDHMVLKSNSTIKVWGWTDLNTVEISVWNDWENKEIKTKAESGYWEIELKTPEASKGHQLIIKDPNSKIIIDDVLIGEVWVFSGQSNMEWSGIKGQELPQTLAEMSNAYNDEIRFFYVEKAISHYPQDEFKYGKWVVCSPEEMYRFSAIGYFFGKMLNKKLGVPMGLINSNWGGTNAEFWMPAELILEDPELKDNETKFSKPSWKPGFSGSLYNSMIHPMRNYSVSGVLWYQGESNVETYYNYSKIMEKLISNWRSFWGENLPFYYAQIAPWKNYSEIKGALLREQQTINLSIPNTAMVITHDLVDDITNIHPKMKIEVAQRFYYIAIKNVYGINDGPTDYPIYKSHKIEKDKIRIEFSNVEEGLMVKGEEIEDLEIAGDDGVFVPAQGKIEDKSLIVYSEQVKKPKHVRFAFHNDDMPNLFCKNGLPVNLFRTDK